MSRYDDLMSKTPSGETDCGCAGKDVGWEAIESVKVLEQERDVLQEWVKQLQKENKDQADKIAELQSEVVELEFSLRNLGY